MGDMSRAALRHDLTALLMESADKFKELDLERFLEAAAHDLSRVRPLSLLGELVLVADQWLYVAPADLIRPLASYWGLDALKNRKPWEELWPGRLPSLGMVTHGGVRKLTLTPAPTGAQILKLSSAYSYRYSARYAIGIQAADTTVPEESRELLLTRATAAALQALANQGVTKPVMLGKAAMGGMPKNGSPAALAQDLLDLFERMAA